VAAGVTLEYFEVTTPAAESSGEELEKSLVCSGVDGRCGDFDTQFVTEGLADLILRGAGLDLHGEGSAIGMGREIRRKGHAIEISH
jgi:hypothetical protein